EVKWQARMRANALAEDPLALAVAVGQGRVKEVAAELDRPRERRSRLRLLAHRPRGEPPHAVADLADLESRSSKFSISHASVLVGVRLIVIASRASACARRSPHGTPGSPRGEEEFTAGDTGDTDKTRTRCNAFP